MTDSDNVTFMMTLSKKVKDKLEEVYGTNIQEILRVMAGKKADKNE